MHRDRMRAAIALACATLLSIVFGATTAAQAAPSKVTLSDGRGAVGDPSAVLGPAYRSSGDVLAYGVGDTSGFHVMIAREKDAYAWTTLATLGSALTETGALMGYTCVTGSGKYIVAVYAPSTAQNTPALVQAGGIATIVDVATGRARQVTTGVELAYYDPACGPTDRVLLTRAVGADDDRTDLIAVDAASAKVVSTRHLTSELTTPTASGSADYGVMGGKLVRVDASGATRTVGTPGGQPFAVRATKSGAVDVLTVDHKKTVAQRFSGGKVTRLGSAGSGRLQLMGLSGGRDALVGDLSAVHASGQTALSTIASANRVQAVSSEGHLLLDEASSEQTEKSTASRGSTADPTLAGQVDITVHAVHSDRTATGTVTTAATTTAQATVQSAAVQAAATVSDYRCAVARNDITRQVPQPSYLQIEWAVDQAVHGDLTVSRPSNYLGAGQSAYTPQGMFPITSAEKGMVPAQVLLAILAQETNEGQATWHATPGDAGNPLVADYYGNGDSDLDYINYNLTDCGYGVGQVTDGMRAIDTGGTRSQAQQVAIATDYAANIAAALQILISKWDQLQADNTYVNDDDPKYIENWFLAVWGYNSGVYPSTSTPYGIGWLNNPANPRYPADRLAYLRYDKNNASIPEEWPYEEKVMGWAETPQWVWSGSLQIPKYTSPVYGSTQNDTLDLPTDYLTFCGGAGQSCDVSDPADPCPVNSSACWWHGNAGWAACPTDCATEYLPFTLGESEPPVDRTYATDCSVVGTNDGRVPIVVDDLDDQSDNVLGCAGGTQSGKFTLRVGAPAGDEPSENLSTGAVTYGTSYSQYGQIDLHSYGAGYQGHMWFTHTYKPSDTTNTPSGADQNYRQVVGQWTPDLSTTADNYDVFVHLPSHGGTVTNAQYRIYNSASDTAGHDTDCTIDQDTGTASSNGTDKWAYLGAYSLSAGARVELSNIMDGATGADIAYDSIVFLPQELAGAYSCGGIVAEQEL